MSRQALEGIKAFGCTYAGTANMVLRTLAMHGATTVRIESGVIPCNLRVSGPFKDDIPGLNRSEYFALFNNDRYSLALNVKHPKAPAVLTRLIRWADIFIENFTPGAMERAGLGYEDLKKINPGIIMLSISQMGQTGPHRFIAGYGPLLQALTGHDHLTGWPDRGPVLIDQSYPDFVAPVYATIAVMAALRHRRRTGQGQYIDLSNLECCVGWISPAILDYTVNGRVQQRQGNRVENAAPHNAYACQGQDAWCVITVHTDEQWRAFCGVMGNPPWSADPKFSTLAGRKAHEAELDEHINRWTRDHTPDDVMKSLQDAGVAAGKVQTCEDVVNNPQIRRRNYFRSVDHVEIGPYPYQAPSYTLSATPAEIRMPAPLLGEHSEYVCRELLGMPEEEYIALLLEDLFV